MTDSSEDRGRRDYEQAEKLFLEGLSIEPDQREAWLETRLDFSAEVRRLALTMLRSDAQIEDDSNHDASDEAPATRLAATVALSESSTKPSSPALPQFDNYEIVEEIARGGMGIVYKARQIRPNRLAAIKMIRSGSFASKKQIERFMTEAEAAAQLDDEAVVPVYELGAVNGEPFIAMKFIDGEDLESLLEREELDREQWLPLLLAVCRAVAAAHARGIIHRDLKPSNILVDRATQRPWITDFGLAKYLNHEGGATAAGEVLGTPGYMAPEQAMGDVESVSKATDVYGLGAILYRLMTGRPPIHSESASLPETIELIREHDVTSPKSISRWIPTALNTICMRCLETDPERRYADAGELAEDLQRFIDGEAIQARPLSWGRRVNRWIRHRPGLAITWCAIALFYAYHHLFRLLSPLPDDAFNSATTVFVFSLAVSAWIWQQWLIRSGGAARALYAWVTSDLSLLTLFLFWAGGVNSSLIVLYPVVVAGSVLRCRTDLVIYVTTLAIVGYCVHLVYVMLTHPETTPPFATIAPFILSLIIIGVIQYYSLRRSSISYEAKAGRM